MIITILKAFQSDQFQYHKKSSQSLFTEKLLDQKISPVQVLTGILYSGYSVCLICLTLSRLVSSFIYVTNFPCETQYDIISNSCHPAPCYLNSNKVFLLLSDQYLNPRLDSNRESSSDFVLEFENSSLDRSATTAGFHPRIVNHIIKSGFT